MRSATLSATSSSSALLQNDDLIAAYHAEREQARYYRALSVLAGEAGNEEDVEALNGLVADEQHHLSRLKNRMVELGVESHTDFTAFRDFTSYPEWKEEARRRERAEIARYERLLAMDLDEETKEMLRGILDTELQHEANLGGKYTQA